MGRESRSADSIFERLAGLYQENPEEFERLSKKLIAEALEELPEEYRVQAHGLQLRIEQRLCRFRDPVARMNEMVVIFWDQFRKFQEVLNDPKGVADLKISGKTPGKVILLDRRRDRC
jgi:hypothetical protein